MKDGKYLFMMLILLVCGITVSAQNKKSDREMFNEGYVLQSKDIHFAPPCEKYEPIMQRLYSIEKRRHETIVTFVQPIYFDSQWVTYGYGYQLVDKKNGDVYMVRRYDGDLPMDRLLIVRGCNRKNILISLVFPKLKRKAKIIDILETSHEKDLTPSNADSKKTEINNILVKKYLVKKQKKGKIYY